MATLTSGGLDVRTLSDIKDSIELDQRNKISPGLDQSSTSMLGQLNSIFANSLTLQEEALAGIYRNMDPESSVGDALDRISSFTGTFRRAATKTSVTASLFFSQTGTFTSGTLLANPVGNDDALFENVHDVVVSSAPATASNVLMRAQDAGPIRVILGPTGSSSLTEIAAPVAGWDGLEASASLVIGTNEETDADLRTRRKDELFGAGSTSIDGIIADISSNVSGVQTISITENTSSQTVDTIPPGGIEVVIFGPDAPDQDIADVIFAAKSAGTPTVGNTSKKVVDSADNQHEIFWTEPVTVPVSMEMDVTRKAGSVFGGVGAVQQSIITNASSSWVPGKDVFRSEVASWVHQVDGVLFVDNIKVNGVLDNFTINNRQIAQITSSNDITVNTTAGSP